MHKALEGLQEGLKHLFDGGHLLYTNYLVDKKKDVSKIVELSRQSGQPAERVTVTMKFASAQKAALNKESLACFGTSLRVGMAQQTARIAIGRQYFDLRTESVCWCL